MKKDKPTIIVTQCHLRFGYNVATTLAEDGFPVIAGAEFLPSMCRSVAGIVKEFRYPNPFLHPNAYAQKVGLQLRASPGSLLIAAHEDVFVASSLASSFPPDSTALMPNFRSLMQLHDKAALPSLCNGLTHAVPKTLSLDGTISAEQVLAELGEKVVIKPRFGEGTRGVRVIKGARYLRTEWPDVRDLANSKDLIAQRYIGGSGLGVGILQCNDELIASSLHKRLREVPVSGGTSTARIVEESGSLGEFSSDLLRTVGFNGVAMLEFRVCKRDGQAYLLDVNPRYWGGLAAHIAAGIRYPTLQVESALHGYDSSATTTVPNRIESRWLLGEIRAAFELLLRGRFSTLKEIFMPSHGLRVSFEELNGNGAWPTVVQALVYGHRALTSLSGDKARNARDQFFSDMNGETFPKRPDDA